MGEAKRRQDKLGDRYGKDEPILPWLPITKQQSEQFVAWTTRGTWFAIIGIIIFWITFRFIGPGLGWWELVN